MHAKALERLKWMQLRRDHEVTGISGFMPIDWVLEVGQTPIGKTPRSCPACEGQCLRTIEMSSRPDVKVPCAQCHGQRFNPETLAVSWRGKSIGDVLRLGWARRWISSPACPASPTRCSC